MRFKILLFISALIVFASSFSCFLFLKNKKKQNAEVFQQIQATPTPNPKDLLITQMSLEQKIGALFMVGFNDQELDDKTIKFFQKDNFNAFLLMKKNIKNREQLVKLTNSITLLKFLPFPAIIAVDQEGGSVNRVDFRGIGGIGEMDLAQAEIETEEQAYQVAKNRGKVLASLGINLNFSPVLEVVRDKSSYINLAGRAFLGDEQKVASLAAGMVRGYQDSGIISVVKHFPGGLGRTKTNPHQKLPVLPIDEESLKKDIFSYKKLIGNNSIKAIMVTHMLYPKIDKENPSSLSYKFISRILRRDLGFDGVVISDDLAMKAIGSEYSIAQAAKLAFLAGVDMILISGYRDDQQEAYETLLQTVVTGEIAEERVDESVKRILFHSL